MTITTTNTIEGSPIKEYLDVVTGEVILGAHIGKDILASFTDFFGGRSKAYEDSLRKARDGAMSEMIQLAKDKGANAVVGVDVDYETIRDGMVMVSVSGTAVKL
ncbi:YbjQ family protein [Candidatus Dojkabacteria bacterium]|uniref:UPF0145 protein KC669_02385 n=1 Tax=Candidatus Dojkabacteria bacterium TaxID=2099670 RepID=A0A955RLA6_9BACT|nr:YbjQ family protein [Candidatus Dojkabacteria bacterium]